MKRKLKVITLLSISLLFVVSCTGLQQFSSMSPKGKAAYFLKIYNSQFDNYQKNSVRNDLKRAQVDILKSKRDLLTKVHPLIVAYTTIIDAGAIPSPEDEEAIIDLIDELLEQAI